MKKKEIFVWLSGLPAEHIFWKNEWMFTRAVFTQESQQMHAPQYFWKWFDHAPTPLQEYILESHTITNVVHHLIKKTMKPNEDKKFRLVVSKKTPAATKPGLLEKIRKHFDEWQNQGHAERPDWYDDHIDNTINRLSNVELLELIDQLSSQKEMK